MPPLKKKRRTFPLEHADDSSDDSEVLESTQPSSASKATDPSYVPLAVVPSIVGRTFASWPDFFSFWEQFKRQHLVFYRTRDCQTTKGYNKSKINHPERQVPESFGYAFRKYVCTLGCKQKSWSTGKRAKRKERYRACKAMVRVAVIRASSGDFSSSSNWTITVTSENTCHNHVNTETHYTALKQCKDLLSESVLSKLDAFGQTNTDTKQIASYVANPTGLPISTQQVRNLMNARLGHSSAEKRLNGVLSEFASTEGNECVLLQGEYDQTIGIVMQTKAQRDIFARWGDTLSLDWTHNCTNLGFYVGTC
ncbi:hypothetical protein GN958_ATG19299 [Phytophthora infestans]|uniref:FAR1 domain-containing protein n=1 Tax=Phytophthora infestans TaxID=4787 RepID=A0A8S9TXG8_PHYIN|nr:hypothetical protein GN958_ATG19299 [Phytophthora infestans]